MAVQNDTRARSVNGDVQTQSYGALLEELYHRVGRLEQENFATQLNRHSEFLVALELKTESMVSEMRDDSNQLRAMLGQMQNEFEFMQSRLAIAERDTSILGSPAWPAESLLSSSAPLLDEDVQKDRPDGTRKISKCMTRADMFLGLGDVLDRNMFGDPSPTYTPLQLEIEAFDRMVQDGKCSIGNMDWAREWLRIADEGALDIYTCLGLSNACTCSPDTRRTMLKMGGVIMLQLLVPCILLGIEAHQGINWRPKQNSWSFRIMGAALYIYAIWAMYKNACDLCRSHLLRFLLGNEGKVGYWWPLLVGELLNVFVSFILVVTMFVIFTEAHDPIELILNAVAVTFLGAVDSELVDEDMRTEAKNNFKYVFLEYGCDVRESWRRGKHEKGAVGSAINIITTLMVLTGLVLAGIFVFG